MDSQISKIKEGGLSQEEKYSLLCPKAIIVSILEEKTHSEILFEEINTINNPEVWISWIRLLLTFRYKKYEQSLSKRQIIKKVNLNSDSCYLNSGYNSISIAHKEHCRDKIPRVLCPKLSWHCLLHKNTKRYYPSKIRSSLKFSIYQIRLDCLKLNRIAK